MTTKEYLSRAFVLDRKIKRQQEQLVWLKSHALYTTPVITDMPKAQSAKDSLVEKTMLRIVQFEESIQNNLTELMKIIDEIQGVISKIGNPNYENILEQRYLLFLKWNEIASFLGVCENRVYQLHREALGMVRLPCND